MFKSCSIAFFLVSVLFYLFLVCLGSSMIFLGGSTSIFSNYFCMDSIFFYLMLLVILLGVNSQLLFLNYLSSDTRFFLFLSLFFSILCFSANHSVFFWCFYELSMLPLLYLIFKDSPYSERFLAAWYFACYLLITSLPLILILLYLSVINGSFFFNCWLSSDSNIVLLAILSFVFFTKVPLAPFHTWLPIVHAEATSIVSIFLSGYIMKLGILGVYRCSVYIFSGNFILYLYICGILCIFFFITAASELDGKRWLAFLSLAHIVIPFLSFFVSDWHSINFCFFYCLGHGLSAGIVFGLLWCFYDLSNSRNWLLLKSAVGGEGIMLLVVICLLSLCSFPPTIQFFCEVGLVKFSGGLILYILFWSLYLFFGGLVPLVLCGHLLIRSEWIEEWECSEFGHFNFLTLLCLWCYVGLIFV
uniref:NADH-ubiquinone oxidoreductase chain 4 n=1 Tax=Anoplocephala perfoliata TaxID=218192 RepID=A0A0N6WKS3_9CEST|nr:NADH dehydrogenase subunit 4 [Anoplocephala perfoliata]AKU46906.1 NADH dehydrogenase subunit 4 [Anoplocephala perfoliata]